MILKDVLNIYNFKNTFEIFYGSFSSNHLYIDFLNSINPSIKVNENGFIFYMNYFFNKNSIQAFSVLINYFDLKFIEKDPEKIPKNIDNLYNKAKLDFTRSTNLDNKKIEKFLFYFKDTKIELKIDFYLSEPGPEFNIEDEPSKSLLKTFTLFEILKEILKGSFEDQFNINIYKNKLENFQNYNIYNYTLTLNYFDFNFKKKLSNTNFIKNFLEVSKIPNSEKIYLINKNITDINDGIINLSYKDLTELTEFEKENISKVSKVDRFLYIINKPQIVGTLSFKDFSILNNLNKKISFRSFLDNSINFIFLLKNNDDISIENLYEIKDSSKRSSKDLLQKFSINYLKIIKYFKYFKYFKTTESQHEMINIFIFTDNFYNKFNKIDYKIGKNIAGVDDLANLANLDSTIKGSQKDLLLYKIKI